MPSPVFEGLADTIFASLGEIKKAHYSAQSGDLEDPEVDVIFYDAHVDFDADGVALTAPRPVAWVKESQVPHPEDDDEIEINCTMYFVREVRNDGLDTFRLDLQKEVER